MNHGATSIDGLAAHVGVAHALIPGVGIDIHDTSVRCPVVDHLAFAGGELARVFNVGPDKRNARGVKRRERQRKGRAHDAHSTPQSVVTHAHRGREAADRRGASHVHDATGLRGIVVVRRHSLHRQHSLEAQLERAATARLGGVARQGRAANVDDGAIDRFHSSGASRRAVVRHRYGPVEQQR